VCGRIELAALEGRARVVDADWQLDAATLAALPEAVRAHQPGFATTGGLHAAALCDRTGAVLAAREDVGRHNAVDKLVGAAVAAGELPWRDRVLVLTGRAGYELLEKRADRGRGVGAEPPGGRRRRAVRRHAVRLRARAAVERVQPRLARRLMLRRSCADPSSRPPLQYTAAAARSRTASVTCPRAHLMTRVSR
jgi:hypothetical protein